MPKTILSKLLWLAIAVTGASAIGGIAIHRGESINAIWFVAAAVCTYLIEVTGNSAAPALWLSLAAAISLSAALMCKPSAEGASLNLVEEPGVVRQAPVHA